MIGRPLFPVMRVIWKSRWAKMNSGLRSAIPKLASSRLADSVCLGLSLDEALAFGENCPQAALSAQPRGQARERVA